MDAPGNWQKVIDKIVDDFGSDNRLDTFGTCISDIDRFSLLAEQDVIGRIEWVQAFFKSTQTSSCKRLDTALCLKREGTALFQKKMYREAARKYSEALMNTPFDSEQLAILYGNRSACLFYLHLLKECLLDVESAKQCNFPGDKLHKLLVREINCYVQLGQKESASQCLECLHKHMDNDSMDCKLSEQKKQEIFRLNEKIQLCSSYQVEEMFVSLPHVSHGENELLVQASQAVDIQHSAEQGRYLMATQDISKGDALIVEQPYAAVLLPENCDTHCQHCYTSLMLNFYPCRRCITVKYCSIDCESLAWEKYHSIECPYLPLLHSVGIAHLSLRVVIVAGLDYLQCFMKDLPIIEERQKYKGFDGSGSYCRSYQSVYDLMTHSEDMETEDLLQYTLVAFNLDQSQKSQTGNRLFCLSFQTSLLLLEVLRHQGWFHRAITHAKDLTNRTCFKAKDNKALTDDEVLIGSLLLRHILQLVCNAHAITQLQCTQVTDSVVEEQSQVRIATAIYPTASLMNHSCDPSIIASFNKDTLVVRAVKDIPKGDEVFNCYGPHFKRMDWDQRQRCLQQQYFFTCRCKPCTDGETNSRSLYSYRCPQCEGPMVTKWSDSLKCQSCEFQSRLDLISVREADHLFEEGVKLLRENRTQDAVNKLLTCYKTRQRLLYKHNKVLSETQDCLARCYASLGNFKESSKFLQQSIETVKVIYGAESIETGNELQKLAEIFISAHMWQEALDCVCVALRIFTQHYGESHDTVQELSNMEKQLVEVLSCS